MTVTTPEKADAYFRNAPEIFADCRVAIIDEAHKLNESGRGALLESLISRWLVKLPQLRLILLSGVMSNAADLARWLGETRTALISSDERPVRQVRGILAQQGDATIGEERTVGSARRRRIDFRAGLVLVHESEDISRTRLILDAPDVITGHYHEVSDSLGRWRYAPKRAHSSYNDHATRLAHTLASGYTTVLVFMEQVLYVEAACRNWQETLPGPIEARTRLADFLALELGPEHDLVSGSRRGVAFHHARLPVSVQRAIEHALQEGWLSVVFATATLREGLNSSATAVIIAGLGYHDETRRERKPQEPMDVLNLAGRAGRPRVETEGIVVLVPDRLARAEVKTSGNRYLLATDQDLIVRSQLAVLARMLARGTDQMDSLPLAVQSFLLGLEAAELDSEETLATFFDSTFFAARGGPLDQLQAAARQGARILTATRERVGVERLRAESRLGLSFTSAEALYSFIEARRQLFGAVPGAHRREDQLRSILTVALNLPEFQQNSLRGERGADDGQSTDESQLALEERVERHLPPLQSWLAGESYLSLLNTGQRSGQFDPTAGLGAAVRQGADYGTWLSWACGAIASITSSLPELEPDPFIVALPSLVRFGVPNLASAYMALLGVADRAAAQRLGAAFLADGQPTTLSAVADWLSQISEDRFEALFPLAEHHLRADLLRRHLFGGRSGTIDFGHVSYRATAIVSRGEVLTFGTAERQDTLTLLRDGEPIGLAIGNRGLRGLTYRAELQLRGIVLSERPVGDNSTEGEILLLRLQSAEQDVPV